MLNLNELRYKLDNMLNHETVDSMNEWMRIKRGVTDDQISMETFMGVLDDIQLLMHQLTLDERNELIDELTCLYERFSDVIDARNGDKQE